MMTLSFCCTVKFFMVVIKPCETSMPKQLSCDHKMIGLGVSHGFMTAMNPLLPLPVMFLFLQALGQMKCNISEAKFKFIIFGIVIVIVPLVLVISLCQGRC